MRNTLTAKACRVGESHPSAWPVCSTVGATMDDAIGLATSMSPLVVNSEDVLDKTQCAELRNNQPLDFRFPVS